MNRLIWLAGLSVPMFPVMVQIRGICAPAGVAGRPGWCPVAARALFPLTTRKVLARLLVPRHLDTDSLAAAVAAGESSPDWMESLV
jgi:hypothetical protein